MSATTLTPAEEGQLQQTIAMFEVIVQSQPNDCQSLEILKEAYTKLGREQDVVNTSKRIAQSYMQMGQLSSAILEYETVLQRRPEDADVQTALKEIEEKANNVEVQAATMEPALEPTPRPALEPQPEVVETSTKTKKKKKVEVPEVEDGREMMRKIFVDNKLVLPETFDSCWHTVDMTVEPSDVIEPFIHVLAEQHVLLVERALKMLADKSRLAFLPLDRYDVDIDMTRGFPADVCRRWCILPFDRMSKSVLVATANPFNQQAARDLTAATSHRLLWYLATPTDLMTNIRKAFH